MLMEYEANSAKERVSADLDLDERVGGHLDGTCRWDMQIGCGLETIRLSQPHSRVHHISPASLIRPASLPPPIGQVNKVRSPYMIHYPLPPHQVNKMHIDMIRGSMAAPEPLMSIMSDYHRSNPMDSVMQPPPRYV